MENLLCITTTSPGMRAFAASAREIIEFAEMANCQPLLDRAGIEICQCYDPETGETETWPAREWEEGEELATAIQVLRDAGVFLTFDAEDPQDRLRFVLVADAHGYGDQARACLDEVTPCLSMAN